MDRNAARREFGNLTLVKEVMREMWGWNSLERLWQIQWWLCDMNDRYE
jgi:hypothetical protein